MYMSKSSTEDDSIGTPVAAIEGAMVEEYEEKIRKAGRRAMEAERERERRIMEAEREREIAETRLQEAEKWERLVKIRANTIRKQLQVG